MDEVRYRWLVAPILSVALASNASAQVVTLLEQNRTTSVLLRFDEHGESASDFGAFASENSLEAEYYYDYCVPPPPPPSVCRRYPDWMADQVGRAMQQSTLSDSSFIFESDTYAFIRGDYNFASYWRTEAVSSVEVRFRVDESVEMQVVGGVAMSADAGTGIAELGWAENVLRLDSLTGAHVDERWFCYDVDTIDVPCPEEALAFRRVIGLSSGEYVFKASARAIAEFGTGRGPMESEASFSCSVKFMRTHVSVTNAPWSTLKQLFR